MTNNTPQTKGETMTSETTTREKVMAYMHYNGSDNWRLTLGQWEGCYFLADGFGQVDRKFANDQCWDWSHVRDSSDQALERIWDTICHWHNRGRLKTAGN